MGMVKAVPYCRETSMGISLVSLQDDKESGERECPFAGEVSSGNKRKERIYQCQGNVACAAKSKRL